MKLPSVALLVSAAAQAVVIYLATKNLVLGGLWAILYFAVRHPLEVDGHRLTRDSWFKLMTVASAMIITAAWTQHATDSGNVWSVGLVIGGTELLLPCLRSEVTILGGQFAVSQKPIRLQFKITDRALLSCAVSAVSNAPDVTGTICLGHRTIANLGTFTAEPSRIELDPGEYSLLIRASLPAKVKVRLTQLK